MKRFLPAVVLLTALCLAGEPPAHAEPFRNLDFESARLPEPDAYGRGGALSHFLALPYWDVQINLAPYDWVLHNNGYLDWSYVAVCDWRAAGYRSGVRHVIEGRVEAHLRAGGWEVPGPGPGPNKQIIAPVSIVQSGTVPEDARSIHLLARTRYDPFTVSLGGEPIAMIPVARLPENVTEYAGDVTRYAGMTTGLTITALPRSDGDVTIDAISFSPVPVPEPSSFALAGLALLGLLASAARGRRHG